MIKKSIRKYGWIPDVPDQRDFLYAAIKPAKRRFLDVDLRKYCSSIEDQGNLGSCTAQALAGNIEFLDNKPDSRYIDTSRLFIYYNERVLEDTIEYDSGSSLRDGIKTLKNDGACEERLWPYTIKKFAKKPPLACYRNAKTHRISSYYRVHTIEEMLTCLNEGYPFVFGFSVYESFESAEVSRTGVVSMPAKGERVIGGHAVMAVGFFQKEKRFLVRNSWGRDWGMEGYFTMPFEYLTKLSADFWTIRKLSSPV